MKFRKKPVVIDAVQWTGENADEVGTFFGNDDLHFGLRGQTWNILTLEGSMAAQVGDWIICGVKGEFYPCKPDIFEATYEPVEPDPEPA